MSADTGCIWCGQLGHESNNCAHAPQPESQPQQDAPEADTLDLYLAATKNNGLIQPQQIWDWLEELRLKRAALTLARGHLDKIINAPNPLGAHAATRYSVIEQMRSCAKDADAALAATKEP